MFTVHMKNDECQAIMSKILTKSAKQFTIPLFQREYNGRIKDYRKLFEVFFENG